MPADLLGSQEAVCVIERAHGTGEGADRDQAVKQAHTVTGEQRDQNPEKDLAARPGPRREESG